MIGYHQVIKYMANITRTHRVKKNRGAALPDLIG